MGLNDAAAEPIADNADAGPDTVPTQLDRPEDDWLDIEQAETLMKSLGVSRTTRTIQRMCRKGKLTARLVPTETGSRYIIQKSSIEKLASDMHEILPSGQGATNDEFGPTEQISSFTAAPVSKGEAHQTSEPINDTIIDLKDQQIDMLATQLETANHQIAVKDNQISVKDEQIATMLERDHETNILIQNLQRMIGLPEAPNQREPTGRAGDGSANLVN